MKIKLILLLYSFKQVISGQTGHCKIWEKIILADIEARKGHFKVLPQNGFYQRENTGSLLFTEVKPCWTGLFSGWVTSWIKYPVLYVLRSQAGVISINYAFHLYYKCCMWIEFQSISTWLRGFSPGTPVSSLRKNRLLVISGLHLNQLS